MQQQQMERAQRAQPHEEYSTDTVNSISNKGVTDRCTPFLL